MWWERQPRSPLCAETLRSFLLSARPHRFVLDTRGCPDSAVPLPRTGTEVPRGPSACHLPRRQAVPSGPVALTPEKENTQHRL